MAIARLRNAARRILDAGELIDRIGGQNIYLEVDDGVPAFLARTQGDNRAIAEEDLT